MEKEEFLSRLTKEEFTLVKKRLDLMINFCDEVKVDPTRFKDWDEFYRSLYSNTETDFLEFMLTQEELLPHSRKMIEKELRWRGEINHENNHAGSTQR